jgi:MFS family permease
MMRETDLFRQPPAARTGRAVRDGLAYVASVPRLWVSFALFAFVGLFSFNLRVALPLLVTRSLHGTDVAVAMLFTAASLGAVVCTLVVAHRRLVKLGHVVAGALAQGLALLLLSAMPSVSAAAAAVFLVGGASMVSFTATSTVLQVDTPREMQGRVLALQTALIGGTALVGGPIVGHLADLAGGRAPIAIGGVVCLVAAGLGELARRRIG